MITLYINDGDIQLFELMGEKQKKKEEEKSYRSFQNLKF